MLGRSDCKHCSCCFVLVSQASGRFKRGFCEAKDWSREVGCPGNAQTQSLGKADADVDHHWGLDYKSCGTFCCSLTSSAVSKATLQFLTSPLISRALFLHFNDCLRHPCKFWIPLLKHIFPSGSWYTWKCQNRHSFPTGHANEHRWNTLTTEPPQKVTCHVK